MCFPYRLDNDDESQTSDIAQLLSARALKRELGDLDRVIAWNRILGMVAVAPGFERTPAVINGFTDLILALYGEEAGRHARSAVGMAALPFSIAVEIEGEVTIEVQARVP